MAALVPCPSCARHVDVAETSCPFCSRALPADLGSRVVPGTTRRLSRLAMFTFASTLSFSTTIVACSDNDEHAAIEALYGCPPAICDSDGGPSDGGGGVQPSYGTTPYDAGEIIDATPPDDASDAADDAD